ncbi:MAG: hypothetical protein GXZ06_03850 [Tissierellia bacterium]|nr:hypothetical protein [Tissierellia bacterium]
MDDIKDMDIIKNIRTVEWLKSELLSSLAYLYEILIMDEDDNKKEISEVISNIILLSLLMGKRVGLSYEDVFNNLQNRIKLNIQKEHNIEKWYGDLSELLKFMELLVE